MSTDSLVPSMSAPALLRDRIEIRHADEADSEGLLTLTRITPMAGAISLGSTASPIFSRCSGSAVEARSS